MKLLIDANILLDVLQNRSKFVEDSSLIWKLCETRKAEGVVSALTYANLVYVMRKELEPETIADVFKKLNLIFHLEDLSVADLAHAAEMKWDDFEDAIQAATAERVGADYIVTRNVKDYSQSKVLAFTPTEILARV